MFMFAGHILCSTYLHYLFAQLDWILPRNNQHSFVLAFQVGSGGYWLKVSSIGILSSSICKRWTGCYAYVLLDALSYGLDFS